MKIKLITLISCLILVIVTSSCGKPEPESMSGNMGACVYDTSVYFYHTDVFSKNKKQEIIVAFWDNNPEYPPESSFSGGESSTYHRCRLTKSYPTVKLQCFAKFDRKNGKGKVNINGEKFDVSNGRLFLINTLVKPIKVIQVNEQFNLPPFNNMSSLDNWSFTKKSVLNAQSSCDKKFEYLAENNKIVAAFLADAKKSYDNEKAEENKQHPLNHPEFKIFNSPRSLWRPGYIYSHDVMDYIFKSEYERKLAVKKLLNAGFGTGKTNYLYIKNGKITINGEIFNTVADAKVYITKSKIKSIRVFGLTKDNFPNDLKVKGTSFYIIPWDKRDLPTINL